MPQNKYERTPQLRVLDECLQWGMLNQKQYDMLLKALTTEGFKVSHKKLPGKDGYTVAWNIEITAYLDTSMPLA